MASINFFFEEGAKVSSFRKTPLRTWLKDIISTYNYSIVCINYIFCSDKYLHGINLHYLKHNTFTDIITFNNASLVNSIEGDIYISIDRVKENALIFDKDFTEELHRVIAHGVLHLLGFKDKTAAQKKSMRLQEDKWLTKNPVPRGTYRISSTWNTK